MPKQLVASRSETCFCREKSKTHRSWAFTGLSGSLIHLWDHSYIGRAPYEAKRLIRNCLYAQASMKSALRSFAKRSLSWKSEPAREKGRYVRESKPFLEIIKMKIRFSLSSNEPQVLLEIIRGEVLITAVSEAKAALANSLVLDALDHFRHLGKPQEIRRLIKHQNFAVKSIRENGPEHIAAEHFTEMLDMLMGNHRLMVKADILLSPGYVCDFEMMPSIECGHAPTEDFIRNSGGIRAPSGRLYRFDKS